MRGGDTRARVLVWWVFGPSSGTAPRGIVSRSAARASASRDVGQRASKNRPETRRHLGDDHRAQPVERRRALRSCLASRAATSRRRRRDRVRGEAQVGLERLQRQEQSSAGCRCLPAERPAANDWADAHLGNLRTRTARCGSAASVTPRVPHRPGARAIARVARRARLASGQQRWSRGAEPDFHPEPSGSLPTSGLLSSLYSWRRSCAPGPMPSRSLPKMHVVASKH